MLKIRAYENGPMVSKLGFGCAPVMGRVSRRQSLRAMELAYEYGITHFDIARSYGFGDAEKVLGDFALQGNRRITITTKFGVVPPNLKTYQRVARPFLRKVKNNFSFMQKVLKNNSSKLLSERRYDLEYCRSCLETSLRVLRKEQIDFYLIHEPEIKNLVELDGLKNFLDDQVLSGKIGRWGIALPELENLSQLSQVGSIQQYPSFINDRPTFKYSTSDFKFITRPLNGGGALRSSLTMKVSNALEVSTHDAAFALAGYQAGINGSIIVGMFNEEHITQNVDAMKTYLKNKELFDQVISKILSEALHV